MASYTLQGAYELIYKDDIKRKIAQLWCIYRAVCRKEADMYKTLALLRFRESGASNTEYKRLLTLHRGELDTHFKNAIFI